MSIHIYYYNSALALLTGALVLMCTSCFGDEPANCEADIETATLHVSNPESFFYQLTDSVQTVMSTDTAIVFTVKGNADVTSLSPQFTLTPGATINPANGSTHDFSQGPVLYTVTSQDGRWTRRYSVKIIPTVHTDCFRPLLPLAQHAVGRDIGQRLGYRQRRLPPVDEHRQAHGLPHDATLAGL